MKELKKYIARQIILYGLFVLISWAILDGAINLVVTKVLKVEPNIGVLNEAYLDKSEEQVKIPIVGGIASFYYENTHFKVILLVLLQFLIQVLVVALLMKICIRRIGLRIEQENHRQLQEKNELFANIAHDLKTPITTLTGYSRLLLDGMVPNKIKEEEYLKAIYSKANRMNQLIDVLFSYTRLDSLGYQLDLREVDFAELIRKNIAMVYSDYEEAGLELVLEIPEDKVLCRLDNIEMSRAVSNLLNNEIRHCSRGTTVTARLEVGETITLYIADNGEPISPQIADTLFEPFVLGDESRSTRGGTGLGLAIAKKIIEKHGGFIYLNSDIEWGTKAFVIELRERN